MQLKFILFVVSITSQCFEFKNNDICPLYSDFKMPTTFQSSGVNVTDENGMKVAFATHFESSEDNKYFKKLLGCSNLNMNQLKTKFRATHTCSYLLNSPEGIQCNKKRSKPLCKKDCNVFWASFDAAIRDPAQCPLKEASLERLDILKKSCEQFPFNGEEGDCISSELSEEKSCGFHLNSSKKDLCDLCRNDKSDCCTNYLKNNDCTWTLAKLIDANLIISSISIALISIFVFFLILILILFLVYKSKRKRKQKKQTKNKDLKSKSITKKQKNIHNVAFPYHPKSTDELPLDVCDKIEILERFDYGWARGKNLNTDQEGLFPEACLLLSPKDNTHIPVNDVSLTSNESRDIDD